MHELPELEIQRAFLAEQFAGSRITHIECKDKKMKSAHAESFAKEVVSASLWFVERRGSNFLFHLDNGKRLCFSWTDDARMYVSKGADAKEKDKAALSIYFGDNKLAFYGLEASDIELLTVREAEKKYALLGGDPLDRHLTVRQFKERFARKRSSLKTALTDEALLAGIGNVYADEIAFRSELSPAIKLSELTESDWEKLFAEIRAVLKEAIQLGGIEQNPLHEEDEATGGYFTRLQVYGKDGESCSRCGSPIIKKLIGRKKSFLCSKCQKE